MTREGAHPSPSSGALAAPEDFPLLAHEAAGDGGLVYLNSAATTQKPSCVLEALDAFYRTANANPHRGAHRLGTAATEALEAARRDVARLMGADADEIAFTSGTTCALNQLAYGLAGLLHPGDEVAVSLLEHHSNLVPWLTVARIAGAKVRHIVPDRQGRIPDDEIDRVIGPRTRIVAVSHVSNVRGVGADLAAHALDRRNVAVRSGAHCAQPLVRHLGAETVCRASTGVYTSERDVDRFLEAVEAARQDAASLMAAAML